MSHFDAESFGEVMNARLPKETTPERRSTFKREQEVKIFPENLEAFTRQLEQLGAILVHPRRKLRDKGYRISEEALRDKPRKFELRLSSFELGEKGTQELQDALELLTGEPPTVGEELIIVHRPATIEQRNVRIRTDGVGLAKRIVLTVKGRQEVAGEKTTDEREGAEAETLRVKDVHEENVELRPAWVEHVKQLLKSLGYKRRIIREKYRTTYQLNDATIETNEYPFPDVPPSVEIEGTPDVIARTLDELGYDRSLARPWSDSDYFGKFGKSKEERNNAVFPEEPSLLDIAKRDHGKR